MKANIHEFDGLFRVLLFILSVIWAVMTSQWISLIPGGILFATALTGWCPVYAMIGINAKKEAGRCWTHLFYVIDAQYFTIAPSLCNFCRIFDSKECRL